MKNILLHRVILSVIVMGAVALTAVSFANDYMFMKEQKAKTSADNCVACRTAEDCPKLPVGAPGSFGCMDGCCWLKGYVIEYIPGLGDCCIWRNSPGSACDVFGEGGGCMGF